MHFFHILFPICLFFSALHFQLTPTLMELVEVISMSTISCEIFESVLSIYIELIAVVPHSELIKHLLSYIRKAPHFQVTFKSKKCRHYFLF